MHPARLPLIPLLLALLLAIQATAVAKYDFNIATTNDPLLFNRCFLPEGQAVAGTPVTVDVGASYTGVESAGTSTYHETNGTFQGITRDVRLNQAPQPSEPLIYGLLLDAAGEPRPGVEVALEWDGSDGTAQRATTVTLTAEAARLLGDPGLVGYYFFNRERLGVTGTATVIVPEERAAATSAVAEPDVAAAVNATAAPARQPAVERVPVEQETASAFRRTAAATPDALARIWPWLLGILVAAAVLFAGQRAITEAIIVLDRRRQAGRFEREARRLAEKTARELMEKPVTVEPDAPAQEATAKLLQGAAAVIVMGERVEGVITATDAMRGMRPGGQARGLMAKARAVPPETPFAEMAEALRTHPVLVVRAGKTLGLVTRRGLLEELDRFFTMNMSDARAMPTAKEVGEAAVTMRAEEHLDALLARIDGNAAFPVAVTRCRKGPSGEIEEVLGTIGARRLLEEVVKYPDTLGLMDAGRVSQTERHGINKGVTLFEANKMLLEQEEHGILILSGSELKGVLAEQALLDGLLAYLDELYAAHQTQRER